MKLYDQRTHCWTYDGEGSFTGQYQKFVDWPGDETIFFLSEGLLTIKDLPSGEVSYYWVAKAEEGDAYILYDVYELETELEVLQYRTMKGKQNT